MSTRVLLVCRANLCRSPSAEVLLRVALDAEGADAVVGSAGMEAVAGQEAPEAFYDAALQRGIELRAHAPTPLTVELAAAADLVLPMTRDLLREMVVENPSVWPRAFTLLELVRRGTSLEPPEPTDTVATWTARVHAGRDRAELLGRDPNDDVYDPLSDPEEGPEAMFAQLEPATRRLASMLATLSG